MLALAVVPVVPVGLAVPVLLVVRAVRAFLAALSLTAVRPPVALVASRLAASAW